MRKMLVLIIATLFVVTLRGQIVIKNIQSYNGIEKQLSIDHPLIYDDIIRHQPTIHKVESELFLKSAQVEKQCLDSEIIEVYDNFYKQWNAADKREYLYNSEGRLAQAIYYVSDNITKWVARSKSEMDYNVNGNIAQSINYDWIISTKTWSLKNKDVYTYDVSGNLSKKNEYVFDISKSSWNDLWMTEYTYNASGKRIQEIKYIREKSSWYNYDMLESEYNSVGLLIKQKSYFWDLNYTRMVYGEIAENTYDATGNLVQQLIDSYNQTSRTWNNREKLIFSYNSMGDRIQEIGINSKSEFTYNDSYSFSDILFTLTDDYLNFNFKHMLVSAISFSWDQNLNQWVNSIRSTLHYSKFSFTNIENIPINDIKIYPNPASNFIAIDISNNLESSMFELYDLNGKKVISQILSVNKQISVSQLNRGIYLYKITQKSKIFNGKIMIK